MKVTYSTKWVIYKITNPKGRQYIGKTCRFKIRMSSYRCNDCAAQKILYSSLKKYGFGSHSIEIIEEFESTNEYANEREIHWIELYKTNIYKYSKEYGMNLTNGGDGTFGRKMSDEQKNKIAAFMKTRTPSKGYIHTEEHRKNHSLLMKGRPAWNKGVKSSPETIAKQSAKLRGRSVWNKGLKNTMSKEGLERMRQANTGHKRNVGRITSEETRKKQSILHLGKIGRKTPILQYDLNGNFIQEYDTVKNAAKILNVTPTGIFNILSGKIKNPKRFTFKRKEINQL